MKKFIINLAMTALLIGPVIAQPGVPPVGDAYTLLSGEHTPVIYSGSGQASSSAGYTTQWLQMGYSPNATAAANSNIGRYNPEQFTLGLKLSLAGGADSTLVSSARFELAYDTSSTRYWIGDSSNTFLSASSSSRSDYGIWTFGQQANASRGYLYPLRALQGGYIRLVFETTTSDAVVIEWTLTGEH